MSSLNSKLFKFLFLLIILFVLFLIISFAKNKSEVSKMVITSFGELTVLPNEVALNFSLDSSSNDYNNVVNLDINSYNNILASLVSNLGIKEDDVKTISYSINPKYSYKDGNSSFEGFSLYHSYNLSIPYNDKNFQSLINVLQSIKVESNTKFNFSLNFLNNEMEKYESDVYDLAIKLADKKAKSIASSSGVSIVRKLSIIPLDSSNNDTNYAMPKMSLLSAAPNYQAFTPSEIKIMKGIKIIFEIK